KYHWTMERGTLSSGESSNVGAACFAARLGNQPASADRRTPHPGNHEPEACEGGASGFISPWSRITRVARLLDLSSSDCVSSYGSCEESCVGETLSSSNTRDGVYRMSSVVLAV